MKNKLLFLLIFIPELLPFIIFITIFSIDSSFFIDIANVLFIKNGGNLKILTILNIFPIAVAIKYTKDILLPKDNNRALLNWPLYGKFKIVATSTFCVSGASGSVSIVFFIFNNRFIESIMGLLYISLTVSTMFSLITLIFASYKIRMILEKYS